MGKSLTLKLPGGVYSSCKGYIGSLTRSFDAGMRATQKNAVVMGTWAGVIQNLGNTGPLNIRNLTSIRFARASLSNVGCGYTMASVYRPYWLEMLMVGSLPEKVTQGRMIDMMRTQRDCFYNSAKREA